MRFDVEAFARGAPRSPWAAYLIALGFEGGPIEIEKNAAIPEVLWPLRAITRSYAPFTVESDSMWPHDWELGLAPCSHELPIGYNADQTWTIAGDSGHSWVLAACWDDDPEAVELHQLSIIDEPEGSRIGRLGSELERWLRAALRIDNDDELSVDFGGSVRSTMVDLLQNATSIREQERVRAHQALSSLEAAVDRGAEDSETIARWEQAQSRVDALARVSWEHLLEPS